MAQAMTEENEAKLVAQRMESRENGEIEMTRSSPDRYEFKYEGVVHAHRIDSSWKFLGFGDKWFAITREE